MARSFLYLVVSVLAGCASLPPAAPSPSKPRLTGEVSGTPIEALPQEEYESKPNVHFENPTPFPENAAPVYPGQLLADRLPPVRLSVRAVVNEQGQVTSVSAVGVVPVDQQPFFASAQAALLTWKFLPLVQITEGSGMTKIVNGDSMWVYPGQAKALPFHQDYAFVFQQHDGKGTVSTEDPIRP